MSLILRSRRVSLSVLPRPRHATYNPTSSHTVLLSPAIRLECQWLFSYFTNKPCCKLQSSANREMYPSHFTSNIMQRRLQGCPGVRAQVRLQRACAKRPIEKTGDSSTPLRMTCWPIVKHDATRCHPEEAWIQRRRNPSVTRETGLSSRGLALLVLSLSKQACLH